MMVRLISIPILFLITSCSTPVIDGTSKDTFYESLGAMQGSLSSEKQEALSTVYKELLGHHMVSGGGLADVENSVSELAKNLHGMSADEIIDFGNSAIIEREGEERKEAKIEIEELRSNRSLLAENKENLSKIEIVKSRYYTHKGRFSTESVIDMTVKNNSEHAISVIRCEGVYKSPERTVPWATSGINYKIPGGLEPGEEQRWELIPSSWGDFDDMEMRQDAVLSVRVESVEDLEGESLYSLDIFDEEDSARLAELEEQYPDL